MKKVLLAAVFLLSVMMQNSFAEFVDFAFTGNEAVKYDFNGWDAKNYGATFLNGPAATNVLELADEFHLDQETKVNSLRFNALVQDYDYGPDSSVFYFDLYDGAGSGPVPDHRIFQVQTPLLLNDTYTDKQFNNVVLPFDVTLGPGTYWLSKERGVGSPICNISAQYSPYAAVPEPASLFLLGVGLVGLLRRKKFSAGS